MWYSATTVALFLAVASAQDDQARDDSSTYHNREVLLGLFQATGGFDWTDSTSWFQQNVNVCDWMGVTCYPDNYPDARRVGHIRHIRLVDNHLVGTVPTNVFAIPYLQTLDINGNADLDVDLSGLNAGEFLEHLNMGETAVTNIDNIGDASNLHTLHITNLGLSGAPPASLFDLGRLAALFANGNSFSGPLPPAIGRLTSLDELYLYGNDFTGQIPSAIGSLSLLEILTLSQNSFGGTLPTQLEAMTDLKTIAIAREDDNPKGPGISGPVPSFKDHTGLTQLDLENQKLNGQLDTNFLLNCPGGEEVSVDLTNNQISGTVPASLATKAYMNLFLAGNQFTAVASQVFDVGANSCPSIGKWMDSAVDQVGCNAFLCPPGTWAPEGRSTADDQCASCLDNTVLWGRTECAGSTPSNVQEREVLVNFYNVMGGRNWKNDDNWLSLDVSICSWFGVDCTDAGKVSSVILRDNGLSGTFPQEVFSLSELRNLDLNSNPIQFDFDGVASASNMETLDLTATSLSDSSLLDIDKLGQLANLKFLSLASNDLGGALPAALFTLVSLEELDVSHNRFTGRLPTTVGALNKLKTLAIDGNLLTGQLPTQLGNLRALLQFSAGENQFGGTLPTQLNSLTDLQSLSLSQVLTDGGIGGPLLSFRNMGQLTSLALDSNKLTGELPTDFLVNSRFLGQRIVVGLSDNEFSGIVPSQWSRFDRLFVDLAGNKITGIHETLCDLANWMDGDVGQFQCDAILCPKGSFNEVGRQSDDVSDCESCSDGTGGFLGATACGGKGTDDADSPLVILEKFFIATDGVGWINNQGWVDSTDYCTFFGVFCDGGGHVSKIDLTGNGVRGTNPSNLFQLPRLRELILSNNDMSFSFDGIADADSLITLHVDNTNLASLQGVGNAPNLVSLNAADNVLAGQISTDVFLLSTLRELNLGYNMFTGKIPNIIGALTSLEELHLYHNGFTDRIPAALGDLTSLRVLNLAENNFDGTIPQELNDLTNLRFLSLQREGGILGTTDVGVIQGDSSALGPGLSGKLPAFENFPYLTELYLGVNSLSGPVPFNFLDGVLDTTVEVKVDLTSNRINGTIPASLTQFDSLSLYLADNRIAAIADGLCSKSDWLGGDVGTYNCDGILCPAGTYNRLGRKGSGATSCDSCSTGTNNFMGSAECLSSEEHATNSERAILERMYGAMRGELWIDSTNWLDPDESICTWFGIKCVSDDVESVMSIDLESNRLHDVLPTEVYSLPNLKELNLQGNVLQIPFHGIGNAQKLNYLDIEGCALTTLAGLEAASSLKVLRVGGNSFDSVPPEIYELNGLEVLSMSDNAFASVPMPNNFITFTDLVYFACSSCGFTGLIPAWLGTLQKLEYLRLDQNALSGSIPTELELLPNLKHIDFSDQATIGRGIEGPLPAFASQTQLTEIYLQHNNIQGGIPSNFLQGVSNPTLVTVDLRYNRFNEALPTELGRLDNLNLYIASNNMADPIPDALCNKPWNDGNTVAHGCNAIACPKGTFNAFGRAIGNLGCLPCDEQIASLFLGNTFCGSILEHTTLILLYREFGGANWKSDQNWLRSEDHCTWEGITCHADGEFSGLVKEINLEDNNLVGSLRFSQVWNLEGLEYLNLQKNDIDVPFDSIGNAINLKTVVLSETSASSLDGIGAAASLESLHITDAKLEGTIPLEFYDLENIEEVYMSHNELGGTLDTKIGDLKLLRDFYIFGNKLTGRLPTELGFLARIEHLSLGENKFTGTIPVQITSLPLLEVLSIQKEEDPGFDGMFGVGGGGLTGSLPALDGLPRIRELYLGYNSFTGTIPNHFLQGVTDKSQQVIVDLSFNSLDGSIPADLSNFADLQILLAANNIDAVPDEICGKLDWMNGGVAAGCDAILCEPGTFNEFGRRIGTATPCQPCTYPGSSENYGSTSCGPVNVGVFTDREILFELYDAAGGQGWFNNEGWEDDNIDFCRWHGITCGPGSLGEQAVIEISLSANGLRGIIPSVIYHLTELKKLDVRNNDVTMQFGAIHQAASLEQLYLDETRVSQLNGIGQAASLQTLHIKKASFNGQEIPDDVFALSALTDLDLSDSMFGGTLSSRIGDMTNLQRLSLSGNAITGQIPSEIGLLVSLKDLELSNNGWFGTLPDSLSGLQSLEGIFLDNIEGASAGISGSLHSFSTMPDLREVHFSNNQLTGTIPTDFLTGVSDPDRSINVHLDSNHLVGTVPSELSEFSKLNIELADNLFVALGDGLCTQSGWLDGAVGQYSCDGILCPAGTFSSKGRQTSSDDKCESCPGDESSPYMGTSVCISLQKQREREVLAKLFQATGGTDWINKDGWMDNAVDICDWYGISCQPGSTVESILLGRNHLVGTVPTEIYQLPNLKFLWLYSNPIDVSFDNIEEASKLQSLLLGSTKLRSLKGIGRARGLIDVDVRFNQMTGSIPAEIVDLVNLESFTCSENDFGGRIPNLTALRKLNTLRMSKNRLTGPVPPFSGNPQLRTLDLSENRLTGSIPVDLLQTANLEESIFLDLSENVITGTVPGELRRFSDLTIYLRDNRIKGIDPELCTVETWNGGDVGAFECDGILCPSGTYSPTGRASKTNDVTCEACSENKYFGSTICGFSAASARLRAVIPLALTIFSVIGVLIY